MEDYPNAKQFADPTKGSRDESTLAILVPAAEPLVREFRARYDTSANEGMPAHITIIWPFIHPDELNDHTIVRIEKIIAESPPISFALVDICHFDRTALYLRPEPDDTILTLIQAVQETFPDYPPYCGAYGGSPTPHLTLAQVNTPRAFDRADMEFRRLSKGRLPIRVEETDVSLLERRNGLWHEIRVFNTRQKTFG